MWRESAPEWCFCDPTRGIAGPDHCLNSGTLDTCDRYHDVEMFAGISSRRLLECQVSGRRDAIEPGVCINAQYKKLLVRSVYVCFSSGRLFEKKT